MERNDLMEYWRKRGFLLGAAYYLAASFGILMLASPLFRVLGFEYSGFVSLFASLHLLFYCANESTQRRGESIGDILKSLWLRVFFLTSIPLVISVASAFIIPNCSLWDGILFYIEIVYPTALIAMLCGVRFGAVPRSRTKTNIYLMFFWIATLLLSLLPGYFSAKIYTYGWQYGYFPGFVWDEAMELSGGYWISRAIEFCVVASWILFAIRQRSARFIFIVVCAISALIFGIFISDINLKENLSEHIEVNSQIAIYSSKRSLTKDETQYITSEVQRYTDEIRFVYGLKDTSDINIYLFSSADDLYEYVGTREASISKPWKRSVYITKQNLHSLKHELAHILLAEYGSFPFDINLSTGLTEGAAVAIEDDFDGIRSGDEMAARILLMELASGVQQVMQFSGFASNASSQSYVLAGSFSHFLIQKFGGSKFLELYSGQTYEEVYQKPLSSLEQGWKILLNEFQTPMDHYDSLRTLFYFKRTSILSQPCLRRIGKLIKRADQAFHEKNYRSADTLYSIATQESGRLKAIRGRVFCQLQLKNPAGALAILDTTPSAKETNNSTALHLLRGDVIVLATGSLRDAAREWDEAADLKLSDNYFELAYIRTHLFGGINDLSAVQNILSDFYGMTDVKNKYKLIFSVEPRERNDRAAYLSRLALYVSYFERNGQLSDAYRIWKQGLSQLEIFRSPHPNSDEDLFEKLIKKRYSGYEEVFGN